MIAGSTQQRVRPEPFELIGVRFDGSGRPEGQAAAAPTLRDAGLTAALPGAALGPDITVSAPDSRRGRLAGFVNERALLEMVEAVHARVRAAVAAGRFPVLYGADCAVLLGAVPALGTGGEAVGLLHVDAHEDATTITQSLTGEAANMEIALLLGLDAERAPEPLRGRLPALEPEAVALLGQRDGTYRSEIGVASIAGRVRLRSAAEVRADPERIAAEAIAAIAARASVWWLHVDLDVLDAGEFRACGAAADPDLPAGLTWAALTAITRLALQAGGCRGWSIGVYNADLDPDRRDARHVVGYVAAAGSGSG